MPDTVVNVDILRAAVQLACRAPSLHNSQPWQWVAEGAGLHLYVDHSRILPATDKSGREAHAMIRGTDRAYELGIKHGVQIAWGTDTLYNPGAAARQGAQLTKLTRWYKPADILTMATSTNANLLAESGPRNPYHAPLGVITAGAIADLILVDGDPLQNLDLVATPQTAFTVIMKNGELIKSETV
jgi:imidazolonepropionase-like amidohydrolase